MAGNLHQLSLEIDKIVSARGAVARTDIAELKVALEGVVMPGAPPTTVARNRARVEDFFRRRPGVPWPEIKLVVDAFCGESRPVPPAPRVTSPVPPRPAKAPDRASPASVVRGTPHPPAGAAPVASGGRDHTRGTSPKNTPPSRAQLPGNARTLPFEAPGPVYIFIDEYWPHSHGGDTQEGVIAGFVCPQGTEPIACWPPIENHLRRQSPDGFKRALDLVFRSEGVRPFLLPLRTEKASAQADYMTLVELAILLLLGWIMRPRAGAEAVPVHVVLSQQGEGRPGTQRTGYFSGMVRGLSLIDPRFRGWDLKDVSWDTSKAFGLAYADVISNLAYVEGPDIEELKRVLDVDARLVTLPLSHDLLPRLLRLEQLERALNVADIIDLARDLQRRALLGGVLTDLRARFRNHARMRHLLLRELNERFDRSDVSVEDLDALATVARHLLPEEGAADGPPIRLLRAALAVQQANHAGDPGQVETAAAQLVRLCDAERDNHRGAVLVLELHLAVHFGDRFDFDGSERLMRRWKDTPSLWDSLSSQRRGWVLSSLGQALACRKAWDEADACFDRALLFFGEAMVDEQTRERDLDQTRCYRAFAGLAAGRDDARARVEKVLGPLDGAAGRLAGDSSAGARYHHHLLVRALLDLHPAPETLQIEYVSLRERWAHGHGHPWPLIALGRMRLLSQHAPADAPALGWGGMEQAARGGATLELLGAAIGAAALCIVRDPSRGPHVDALLAKCEPALPKAAALMEAVRTARGAPSGDALAALLDAMPYNLR